MHVAHDLRDVVLMSSVLEMSSHIQGVSLGMS